MTTATKQRLAGGLSALSAAVMVYGIYRMIPYGLGGDIAKAEGWFVLMIIAFLISLPCGVAYYYYGTRAKDSVAQSQKIALDTLARLGRQKERQK